MKDWTLKSGRTIHLAFEGIVSFEPCDGMRPQHKEGEVWIGATPDFGDPLYGPPLTPDERTEVAERMIAVWKRWAERGEAT